MNRDAQGRYSGKLQCRIVDHHARPDLRTQFLRTSFYDISRCVRKSDLCLILANYFIILFLPFYSIAINDPFIALTIIPEFVCLVIGIYCVNFAVKRVTLVFLSYSVAITKIHKLQNS